MMCDKCSSYLLAWNFALSHTKFGNELPDHPDAKALGALTWNHGGEFSMNPFENMYNAILFLTWRSGTYQTTNPWD